MKETIVAFNNDLNDEIIKALERVKEKHGLPGTYFNNPKLKIPLTFDYKELRSKYDSSRS